MRVRFADLGADGPEILAGAKNFVSRMDFTDFLPDDDAELAASIERMLTLPGVKLIVAERDKKIVGGIGLLFAPHIWNPALVTSEELFFWCAPDAPGSTALRLLRAAMALARKEGAQVVQFSKMESSPASLTRLYEAMGLRVVNTTYMRMY